MAKDRDTTNKIIFIILSLLLGIFFILWGKAHIFLATLIPRLHFCSYLACVIFSLIWFVFMLIGIFFLYKKKKLKKIWYIPFIVILIVGFILMNLTYCDSEGTHFGFRFGSQSVVGGADCQQGVDCAGDIVAVPIPPCYETDDGQDYITRGMILSGANLEDMCMSPNVLRERYCNSELTYTSEDIRCSDLFGLDWMCENSECVLNATPTTPTPPAPTPSPPPEEDETETNCGDGVDNDLDGDIDCADSDCNIPFIDGGCGDFDYSCQHLSEYPTCGGTCPIDEECIVYYAGDGTLDGGWCECMPIGETSCGDSGGCDGWCLEGDRCVWDSAGCFCEFDLGCLETDGGIDPTVGGVTTYFPVQSIDECVFKTDRLIEYSCGVDNTIESQEIDCENLGLVCIESYPDPAYCGEGEL
ncbi:MAG: hypothetical protein KKF56_05445 [Nanoarchaeota archaeon]|nr:hypothetical protein [Nanoarchaeota archaeon]